jgi:phosphonate transport system substrate-binding protein
MSSRDQIKVGSILFLAIATGLFAGCWSSDKTPSSKVRETPEKLIFAFQPQENPEGMELDVKRFTEFVSKEIGIETQVFLPTSYAAVVEALRSGHAHVAYFSGWPYLVAHLRAGAELLVAEERAGNPYYYSQWFVKKDNGIDSIGDLAGKTIAFTSPSSTSGYLFPLAKVVEEGFLKPGEDPRSFFSEVIYAGGYQQALLGLANGRVEAAAASDYAFERFLTKEQQAEIKILSSQGPVPTHGIAILGSLPQEIKNKVRAALLMLNEEENKELLRSVYGASKLVERDHDEHVKALDEARQKAGIDYPL